MSQPLLQLERRDAFLRFVGGEGVSQGVTAGFFRNSRRFRILDDEFAYPPLRDGFTLVI
jgi:hypothetical protein